MTLCFRGGGCHWFWRFVGRHFQLYDTSRMPMRSLMDFFQSCKTVSVQSPRYHLTQDTSFLELFVPWLFFKIKGSDFGNFGRVFWVLSDFGAHWAIRLASAVWKLSLRLTNLSFVLFLEQPRLPNAKRQHNHLEYPQLCLRPQQVEPNNFQRS